MDDMASYTVSFEFQVDVPEGEENATEEVCEELYEMLIKRPNWADLRAMMKVERQ